MTTDIKSTKRPKQVFLSIIIGITIVISIFAIGISVGRYKQSAKVKEYYLRTENLLDTIYYEQREYMDLLMETDTYYYYQQAKDNL